MVVQVRARRAPSRIGGGIGHEVMTQVLPPPDTLARLVDGPEFSTTFLAPAGWEHLRDMRLAALLDAPEAFVTTFDAEVLRTSDEWRGILERSPWVVAHEQRVIVGIACLAAPDEEGPRKRFIESVWVTPGQRRRGLVRLMLEKLEERAGHEGAESLQLWVLDTNGSAADAYLKLGFEWVTDRVQKLVLDGSVVTERLMIRPLFR